MPTLTLKGLPDHVYHALKDRAAANQRSLNSEVLMRLERSVSAKPMDVAEALARADAIGAQIRARGGSLFTEEEITAAKHDGRR